MRDIQGADLSNKQVQIASLSTTLALVSEKSPFGAQKYLMT